MITLKLIRHSTQPHSKPQHPQQHLQNNFIHANTIPNNIILANIIPSKNMFGLLSHVSEILAGPKDCIDPAPGFSSRSNPAVGMGEMEADWDEVSIMLDGLTDRHSAEADKYQIACDDWQGTGPVDRNDDDDDDEDDWHGPRRALESLSIGPVDRNDEDDDEDDWHGPRRMLDTCEMEPVNRNDGDDDEDDWHGPRRALESIDIEPVDCNDEDDDDWHGPRRFLDWA